MRKILFFLVITLPVFVYGQDQDSSWQVFSLGSPALTINLPGKPEPMEATLPQSLLQIIRGYYAYRYEDLQSGVLVMLFHISYAEKIHTNLNNSAEQTIRELESRGALNIKYSTSPIEIDGKQGIRQTGTLESNGIEQEFSTTIITEGSKAWQVVTYAKAGDRGGQRTIQSILNSISLKEN